MGAGTVAAMFGIRATPSHLPPATRHRRQDEIGRTDLRIGGGTTSMRVQTQMTRWLAT
jgi:hypothetical protein